MKQHWSTVCALFLAFLATVHFDTVSSAGDKCNETGVCVCDDDCPAGHKCCVFDCGAVCVPPAFMKPGRCPRRQWGLGLCAEFCSNDSDCPNDEKCCSNGCGHECIKPYTVKPGRCGLPQGTPMCAEYCYHDGQCPGEQKCCKTTCGHACSEPC